AEVAAAALSEAKLEGFAGEDAELCRVLVGFSVVRELAGGVSSGALPESSPLLFSAAAFVPVGVAFFDGDAACCVSPAEASDFSVELPAAGSSGEVICASSALGTAGGGPCELSGVEGASGSDGACPFAAAAPTGGRPVVVELGGALVTGLLC